MLGALAADVFAANLGADAIKTLAWIASRVLCGMQMRAEACTRRRLST
jgi:hypothetical protein